MIAGVSVDIVIPSTYGIQGHEITRNIRIYQSANQEGYEAPTLTPPQVKDSNLGIYKTVIYLCAEVPHDLPEGKRPKPNKL